MHLSPCSVPNAPPPHTGPAPGPSLRAERAYQGMTILAMLLVLASLVIFW